jgi:protein-disulfide isomerase
MADAGDSKSPALPGCVGSTPTSGTTSGLRLAVPCSPMMNTTIRTIALLTLAAGCASAAKKPVTITPSPSPSPTTSATLMSEEPPRLTPQELIALERAPGSTPPLTQAVERPPAPVAGLGGTPGPSPAYGPEDAPVRIYVFTDFQCPVCPRAVEPLKHLARAYPDDVRIILKMNALASHGRAARLAAASLAAFRQGKFWEFHDRLFANPAQNSEEDLVALAQAIGLDVARFRADMDANAVTEQVKYESALAVSIDLAATPGLVVNGSKGKGWGSYMSVESRAKQALERAHQIAEGGVPASRVAYEATRRSGPDGEKLAAALFAVPK